MRAIALAILGLALAAAPARGAVLPFTGTLSFEIGGLPGVSVSGSGVATVNGSGGGLHLGSFTLASGVFQGPTSFVVPSAAPISGLHFLAAGTYSFHFSAPKSAVLRGPTGSASNDAGSFSGLSGGSGGGVMPLRGVALVCLFEACSGSPSANIIVPLTPVGQGGTVHHPGAGFSSTVIGAPWTMATAVIGSATVMGFAHGPASLASSTAVPGGRISLVTPIFISLSSDSLPVLPTFSRLAIDFVPEPSTLLLLGAGVAALGALGRRLQRQR
jgi:hypothetical protein